MVAWNSTVNIRVRAKEPISVDKLLSRLKLLLIHDIVVDVYSSADQPGCQCRRPGLTSYCVPRFFDLGGVLISCSLSNKWHTRRRFLLDSSFWRLWDVIAMSGWVAVSMLSFQSAYNLNDVDCDGLIPLLPMLNTSTECALAGDELSFYTVGYGMFRDILDLFKHFISTGRWGFGTDIGLTNGTSASFLDYHIRLLDLMISRLAQPVDILHVILELNLWGVCKSSSINYIGPHVADDPLDISQCNAMMLVLRASFSFSVTSRYCVNITKHCTFDNLSEN